MYLLNQQVPTVQSSEKRLERRWSHPYPPFCEFLSGLFARLGTIYLFRDCLSDRSTVLERSSVFALLVSFFFICGYGIRACTDSINKIVDRDQRREIGRKNRRHQASQPRQRHNGSGGRKNDVNNGNYIHIHGHNGIHNHNHNLIFILSRKLFMDCRFQNDGNLRLTVTNKKGVDARSKIKLKQWRDGLDKQEAIHTPIADRP